MCCGNILWSYQKRMPGILCLFFPILSWNKTFKVVKAELSEPRWTLGFKKKERGDYEDIWIA